MQTVVPANKENSAIRTKSELTMQLRGHTADKLYYYGQCDKAFFVKWSSYSSFEDAHKEKPYYCSQCSKAFSLNGYLDQDMKLHIGENPYQCPFIWEHRLDRNYIIVANVISHFHQMVVLQFI